MMPGIISGRAWLQQRQRVLQEELAKDPAPEQRAVLQAALDAVDQELGAAKSRWWRSLLWGTRPPT